MLRKLRNIFDSLLKCLDVFYVIRDIKPVSRILVKEENVKQIKEFLERLKLKVTLSEFKVELLDGYKGYSNIGIRSNIGYYILYLSKSMYKAIKAKKLEEVGEHKKLGKLLGYPNCCSNFFAENFSDEDIIQKIFENSDGCLFPYYTNICARIFDVAIISFFPCSFNCKRAIRTGIKNLRSIEKESREIADTLISFLKNPLIYTKDGIFILRNASITDTFVWYNGMISNKKNYVYYLLKNNNKIKIISNHKIMVDERELNVRFIYFY